MKIAVFISNSLHGGGGFQYELSAAKIFQKFGKQKFDFLFVASNKDSADVLRSMGMDAVYYAENRIQKIFRHLKRNRFFYQSLRRLGFGLGRLDNFLKSKEVDLVYFASPNPYAADLTAHNFVMTTWDLSHRDMVEFPEVSFDREFENRDFLFSNYLPKATAVLADSPVGKNNIVRRYGVDEERVHVIPFLPSEAMKTDPKSVNISEKYKLNGDYIYYPAQFWAHKNHTYILYALARLRDEHGVKLNALFSGSDKGNLDFVLGKVAEFKLEDQVQYIGFVDEGEISSLYGQALAMVMPTYFGMTNIPPLEAFQAGCPLCYSDLEGLKDQVGEGAFLMDLTDPSSLVAHLLQIRAGDSIVADKVAAGKAIIDAWDDAQFWERNEVIFNVYQAKMKSWK